MNKLKRKLGRRPRRRTSSHRRRNFERLEDRQLLAASHVFATLGGAVAAPGNGDVLDIHVRSEDFRLRSGTAVIGIQVTAAEGSNLNPAAVTIADDLGMTVKPLLARNDTRGSQNSLALVNLSQGDFALTVKGEQGTAGAFEVSFFLVGDFDGSGMVTAGDYATIRGRYGARVGTANYNVNADADLDGRITSIDLGLAWRNVGDRTDVEVLTLSAEFGSGVVDLPGGGVGTRQDSANVVGQALPGATVRLDSDGDVAFDDSEAVADLLGNYSLEVPLAEGVSELRLETSDTFGQRREVILEILRDSTAPAVFFDLSAASDSGAKGDLATLFDTVAIEGQTEPGVQVTLAETGASVMANDMGFFSFASVPLAAGANAFSITATDLLGNSATVAHTITRSEAEPGSVILAESGSFLSIATLDVSLAQPLGSRVVQFGVDALFDRTDESTVSGDRLLVYLVNPANPTQTLLGRGVPGTAVFSLTEDGAEFTPGLVRFDGRTVEIDVTTLISQPTGRLVFQLLSGDGDTGSTFVVDVPEYIVDEVGSASPVFAASEFIASAGGALDLTGFNEASDIEVLLRNVRYDAAAGLYTAELRLRNDGLAVGRRAVVAFPGLPSDAELRNPSGQTGGGAPYINLSDALSPGGLENGEASSPVVVQFSYAGAVPFALRPVVLSAGENNPPEIPLLGPYTIMPGEKLSIDLPMTDSDGDPVTYSLASEGNLPTGKFHASGKLEFLPSPEQLGTYAFTILAYDGAVTISREVTLNVVPDTLTTTRVSGVIMGLVGGLPQALIGVPIEITLGNTILADDVATGADGSFTIDFIPPTATADIHELTIKVRAEALGSVYPFIAEKLHLVLEHDVFVGVNNIISRPIYLPSLNEGTPIDAAQPVVVTQELSPSEAMAMVEAAAGSLRDQSGNTFVGNLGITEVPRELTPAALPENLIPDIVVTIQPGEMVFQTPAALTLPNRAGYTPGTVMNLWSINPVTGLFDDVGDGAVSADGSVIETVSGGIRNSSWHFFAPPPPNANPTSQNSANQNTTCDECLAKVKQGSEVELHSGAYQEWHDLVSYQSLDVSRGLSLHYDSQRADPRPIIHFDYSNVTANPNDRLTAYANIQELPFEQPGTFILRSDQQYWTIPAGTGLDIDASLQVDLRSLPTGRYYYTVTSGIVTYDAMNDSVAGSMETIQGDSASFLHVNTTYSPFGSGWGLAGLQQIVVSSDNSAMIIDGDGGELLFRHPGGALTTYISPPGDFSELVQLGDGSFRRTMTDQTVYSFSAEGKLTSMRDRNNNETRYEYNALGIERIVDPVGLTTTFGYTAGKVTSITDPAGRITQLNYDAAGNLQRIIDPDSSSRTFAYDTGHHLTQETNQRGNIENTLYDFAGRVTGGRQADASLLSVAPLQTNGLYAPELTADPQSPPSALVTPPPEAFSMDASGRVTRTLLDQAGQSVHGIDAAGATGSIQRDTRNLPVRFVGARGNFTETMFDDRGNVTAVVDQVSRDDVGALFPGEKFATGGAPSSITTGDLNGDGIADIAVANLGSDDVSVLLGKGDGTFGPERRFAVGGSPQSIAMGDFNGDRNLDLAVANSGFSGDVSVLLGNGDGTFATQLRFFAGSSLNSIVTGDFNGDGNVDLATANGGSGDVSVLLGNGGGTFAAPLRFATGSSSPTSLVTGDFNGDDILDLATLNFLSNVSVMMGNGDGTFAAQLNFAVGGSPYSMITGDFNGDGIPDLATANAGSDDVSVLLANGDGTFVPERRFAVGLQPQNVASGDFNGDGAMDLVTANGFFSELSLLLGNGDGTFVPERRLATDSRPESIATGDFNGDGFVDLATGNVTSADVSVVLGNGDGTFPDQQQQHVSAGDGPRSVTIDDFNSDGIADLATANEGSNDVSLLLGTGDGTFTVEQRFSTGGAPRSIATGDFNGDGRPDLVTANSLSNNVSVLLGDGLGGFDAPRNYSLFRSPNSVAIADLNGDGRLDVITANFDSGDVSVLLGDGLGGFSAAQNFQTFGLPYFVAVADINADGSQDLITANRNNSTLSVLLGNGIGGFGIVQIINVYTFPESVAVADLNRDGRGDLITLDRFAGYVTILMGDGVGGFASPQIFRAGDTPVFVTVADLNGDSRLDVVTANSSVNNISVLLGDGLGGFAPALHFRVGDAPSSIAVADLNRDGRPDLVTANLLSDNVSILLNQGGGDEILERRFTYDSSFSELLSTTNELGRSVLFDIDPANGNRLSMRQVVGDVDDATNGEMDDVVTRYTYTPQGLIDTMTDPLGRVADYDYDARGRLIQVTYAKGTADEATEQYEYDVAKVAGRAGLVTAFVDANGNRTEYEYDVMNRLVRTIEPDSDGPMEPLPSPVTEFDYDPAGNLIETTDARGNVTDNVYDEMDRLIRRIDADPDGPAGPMESPVTKFDYDETGNLITVVDPLGHATQHEYDARNRRIRTVDPDGGVTQFRYDLDNNLTAVIDPDQNRTNFSYDQRNRLLREVDPLGEETRYVYDPVDNLVRKTDRDGRVTRYEYDDLNRLTTETWVGAGDENVIHYAYDKTSNLSSVYDNVSSLVYTYDDRNRVETIDNRGGEATQGTPDAPRVVLTYQYDGVGNVLSVVDTVNGSAGATTGYLYDDLDRLMTLTQVGPGLADKRVNFAYNPLGQYESIDRYRGLAGTQLVVGTSYLYDALNRLDVMRHQNAASLTLNFHDLDYDTASRITRITDIDGTHDYSYDDRDELIGANHTATGGGEIPDLPDENYQYDANGNRLESHLHGTGYVTGRGNRLESDGTYNYEYDDEGNTTKRTRISGTEADGSTIREFIWDHRNRLIAVIDRLEGGAPTQEVRFSYDALDRRISKSVDTTPLDSVDAAFTHFVYDREDVILDFFDADGAGAAPLALDQRYLHGPAIDQVLAQDDAGGTVHWHLTDHLGTVKDLADSSGVVANHIQCDAYGNLESQTNATVGSRYLFAGREFDEDLDLYYNRSRYYSARTGRFISADRAGFGGYDANLYRYVGNDVARLRDPSGLAPDEDFNVLVEQLNGLNVNAAINVSHIQNGWQSEMAPEAYHDVMRSGLLQLLNQMFELSTEALQLQKAINSLSQFADPCKYQYPDTAYNFWYPVVSNLIAQRDRLLSQRRSLYTKIGQQLADTYFGRLPVDFSGPRPPAKALPAMPTPPRPTGRTNPNVKK